MADEATILIPIISQSYSMSICLAVRLFRTTGHSHVFTLCRKPWQFIQDYQPLFSGFFAPSAKCVSNSDATVLAAADAIEETLHKCTLDQGGEDRVSSYQRVSAFLYRERRWSSGVVFGLKLRKSWCLFSGVYMRVSCTSLPLPPYIHAAHTTPSA